MYSLCNSSAFPNRESPPWNAGARHEFRDDPGRFDRSEGERAAEMRCTINIWAMIAKYALSGMVI
jgi:hypothetical protein